VLAHCCVGRSAPVAGLNAERGRWSASVPGRWQQVRRASLVQSQVQYATGLACVNCYWGRRREGYVHASTSASSKLWDYRRRAVCRVRHPLPAVLHQVTCARAFQTDCLPGERSIPDGKSHGGTPRYYRAALQSLQRAVSAWQASAGLHFVIHLGARRNRSWPSFLQPSAAACALRVPSHKQACLALPGGACR